MLLCVTHFRFNFMAMRQSTLLSYSVIINVAVFFPLECRGWKRNEEKHCVHTNVKCCFGSLPVVCFTFIDFPRRLDAVLESLFFLCSRNIKLPALSCAHSRCVTFKCDLSLYLFSERAGRERWRRCGTEGESFLRFVVKIYL